MTIKLENAPLSTPEEKMQESDRTRPTIQSTPSCEEQIDWKNKNEDVFGEGLHPDICWP